MSEQTKFMTHLNGIPLQDKELREKIASLDSTLAPNTHEWAKSVTQEDGQITVEYSQPDASDITYTKGSQGTNLESDKTVDDALDKLDETIGNLDSIKFDGQTATTTIDNLIAIIQKVINHRIARDDALLGTEDDSLGDTIKGLRKHIEGLDLSNSDNPVSKNNAGDSKWINTLTQTDGQVYVEYTQPNTNDIVVSSEVDIKNNESSTPYSNLTAALNDESLIRYKADLSNIQAIEALTAEYNGKVSELEAADAANADALNALSAKYAEDLALLQKADNKIESDINTIRNETLPGIEGALDTYITEHAQDYTNTEIDGLIANQKIDIQENGGIIDNNGIQIDPIYLSYLKKMTFATPSIDYLKISTNSNTLEVGKEHEINAISHRESNINNIKGTLTLVRKAGCGLSATTIFSNISPSSDTDTILLIDMIAPVIGTTAGTFDYVLEGEYMDTEEQIQQLHKTSTVTYYWPHFYGSSSNASLTNVSGLNKSSITSSNFTGSLDINNNADEYVYFVTIDNSLTVKSGGFDVPLTKSTLILDINGESKTYNVYRTNQLNAGTLTYELS